MDLYLLSLSTLLPEASCYVFGATKHQMYRRFDTDDMTFASILIWFHTHKQIHTQNTGTNRLKWEKYILTPPVMYLKQLSVLLN